MIVWPADLLAPIDINGFVDRHGRGF